MSRGRGRRAACPELAGSPGRRTGSCSPNGRGVWHSEALGEEVTGEEAIERVDGHISRCSLHVWEDGGRAVSVAAAVAPTPHGIRINNVYTPPELRGRGYAGALVAALTEHVLDSGRQFAFLHTDLSNPTSNALYVRIGYRRVAELQMLRPDVEINQGETAKMS